MSNVVLLSVTAGWATAWYLLWSPVVPLLLSRQGAGAAAIAATFAAMNIGGSWAQWVGGRLADRVGPRAVIGWTGMGLGASWLGMAASAGWWPGLAAFFVAGNLLFGLQSTAFLTVVAGSTEPSRRAAAFSYYQWWNAAALVVGPAAGAFWVLRHLRPAAYLACTGLVYLTVGLLRLWGLKDPRPDARHKAPPLTWTRFWHSAAATAQRRRLLVLTAGVTTTFALTVNGPFLPLATHALDHMDMRQVDLFFGVGAVGALASSSLAARLRSQRQALVWGLGVHAVASTLLAFPLPRLAVGVAYVAAFTGFQVATVAFSTLRVEFAGEEAAGEVLGATSALAGAVAFFGLTVGGFLGSRGSLWLAAAVALATALWASRQLGQGREPVIRLRLALLPTAHLSRRR